MKALITIPHSFFMKKVAGIPLIVRIIRLFQNAGFSDIYIMSNILELNESGNIHIIRKKEEISQNLGKDYYLVDIPVVFNEEFLSSLMAFRPDGIVAFSRLHPENYPGVFVPIQQDKDIRKGEKKLLNSLRKPQDTFVSRTLNRPVSLFVSRFLMKTFITPNLITLFVTLIGILATLVLIIRPDYWGGLMGGTLFHLSSVLDGCDGEIARLKFKTSELGVWLDNIGDELTNFLFIGALGIYGATYYQNSLYLYMGLGSMGVFLVTKIIQYFMILRGWQKQDIAQYKFDFETKNKKGFKKFLSILFEIGKNIARNDFLALGMMVAGILGWMHVAVYVVSFFSVGLFFSVLADFFSKLFSSPKKTGAAK